MCVAARAPSWPLSASRSRLGRRWAATVRGQLVTKFDAGQTGLKVAAATHSGYWVASHLQAARARPSAHFCSRVRSRVPPEVSAGQGLLRGSRDRPSEQRVALLYPLGVHRQLGETPRARTPHPTRSARHVIGGDRPRLRDKGCEEPTCCALQNRHKGNPPTTPDTPNCRDRCEKDTCRLQLKVELPTAANAPHETRRVLRSYRTRRQDATATAAEPREDAVARSYCLRLYLRLAAIAC